MTVGVRTGFNLSTAFTRAAAAAVVRRRERDEAMQRGLDSFRASTIPTYQTPEGRVSVATPFAMSPHYRNQQATLQRTGAHIQGAANQANIDAAALARLGVGRGRPRDIERFTQAPIDRGLLSKDASSPLVERVRQLMFDHGIGIDCAGYVQQAYLAATKTTRAGAHLAAEPMNESLAQLSARGYHRIAAVRDIRPGDLGVLGPPAPNTVGHRVIVYDHHEATLADMTELLDLDGPSAAFAVGGPLHVLTVDSSWGCGDQELNGYPAAGGVLRRTWWYNESAGLWGWATAGEDGRMQLSVGQRVYDHPLEGFYRRTDSESIPLPTVKR